MPTEAIVASGVHTISIETTSLDVLQPVKPKLFARLAISTSDIPALDFSFLDRGSSGAALSAVMTGSLDAMHRQARSSESSKQPLHSSLRLPRATSSGANRRPCNHQQIRREGTMASYKPRIFSLVRALRFYADRSRHKGRSN